jgi:hypothetical protein
VAAARLSQICTSWTERRCTSSSTFAAEPAVAKVSASTDVGRPLTVVVTNFSFCSFFAQVTLAGVHAAELRSLEHAFTATVATHCQELARVREQCLGTVFSHWILFAELHLMLWRFT